MEPENPSSFENLFKALGILAPDKLLYYKTLFKQYDKDCNFYGNEEVKKMKHKELILGLLDRLVDASDMSTEALAKHIKKHREENRVNKRGYFLIYSLFFGRYTPYIEFKRCFHAECIHFNTEVPNGYTCENVYIDSMKDEINLSGIDPISIAGMGAGNEFDLDVDMDRMASSLFEKVVWPRIRERNQFDENAIHQLEQQSDNYDEDYL